MDWEAEGRLADTPTAVRSFSLDATEVTEQAYDDCVAAGACARVAMAAEPARAVVGVTRAEAEAYCRFRSGRLPTTEEWTWVAAGPKGRRYPWGDTGAVCRRGAWGGREGPCGLGATGPELVATHPDGRTAEGIYDLAGNVAEWVQDHAGLGIVRGGSWASAFAAELRTWHERRVASEQRSADVGFRCAYDIAVESLANLPGR